MRVFASQLGFAQQLDDMISEAEQVATELYGETQSPQDMQVRSEIFTLCDICVVTACKSVSYVTGEIGLQCMSNNDEATA